MYILTTPMQYPSIAIGISIWLKHNFHRTGHSISY